VHWRKTECHKPMANKVTTLITQKAVLGGDSGGSRGEHHDDDDDNDEYDNCS